MAVVLICFFGGFLAIMLEVIIPGGVLGSVGVALLGYAVYASWGLGGTAFAISIIAALLGAPVAFLLGMLLLPVSPIGRLLTLRKESRADEGYDSSEPGIEELLGQTGRAVTKLRPSGMALFGDRRVDVVSDGFLVEKGALVEVVKVEGNRVVVVPADEADEEKGEGAA